MRKQPETRIVDGNFQKKCCICNEFKELSEFSQKATAYLGYQSRCKECHKGYYIQNRERALQQNKDRYYKDPQKRIDATRDYVLRKKYNLTRGEFESLVQDGCGICGTIEGKMNVDHDHDTEKVRGILCHNCNVVLGLFKDNVDLFLKAAAYLEHHKSMPKV